MGHTHSAHGAQLGGIIIFETTHLTLEKNPKAKKGNNYMRVETDQTIHLYR